MLVSMTVLNKSFHNYWSFQFAKFQMIIKQNIQNWHSFQRTLCPNSLTGFHSLLQVNYKWSNAGNGE